jgi:curved DNA-binding protein CbpA
MDHYSVLGLSPSATKEQVKAAFRKLALQHHPDLHLNSPEAVKKNSEAAFKSIKAAFEAIADGKDSTTIIYPVNNTSIILSLIYFNILE